MTEMTMIVSMQDASCHNTNDHNINGFMMETSLNLKLFPPKKTIILNKVQFSVLRSYSHLLAGIEYPLSIMCILNCVFNRPY